jgi:hypothetical protein
VGQYQQIKKGVRQGCILSPDLFLMYSEITMRENREMPGISIEGHTINNVRFFNDTVLIPNTEENLQELMNIINTQSIMKRLSLNFDKTETMIISKKNSIECNIILNGSKL